MSAPESPSPALPAAAAPGAASRGWGAGRVLVLIVGIVAALIALALLAGGGALLAADRSFRDDDGYLTTPDEVFQTTTFALASEGLDIETGDTPDWLTDPDRFGEIKIEASSRDGKPLFVGVGPQGEVNGYLGGVAHDIVTDFAVDPFSVTYERQPGRRPRGQPSQQPFWAATATGSPDETLNWDVESGNWTVVVMNADASRGVAVNVAVGAKIGFLLWIAIGLLVVGGILLVGSAFLIYLAFRRPRAPATAPAA